MCAILTIISLQPDAAYLRRYAALPGLWQTTRGLHGNAELIITSVGEQLDEDVYKELIVAGKVNAPAVGWGGFGRISHGRMLYLLMPDDVPAYVRKFAKFPTSPEATPILKQAGYLPLK
ncbi:MAG: hypothetical protein CO187_09120 [Zetaproteobacteria bacterium CG_4_9_14_3_um_filter_53_7]|nr:MAG: hypothetical protein CO187_09120 [Zetaproteobacteria bacterium CG_4_9_14_3_um_filter_53_7]